MYVSDYEMIELKNQILRKDEALYSYKLVAFS